MSDVIKVDYEGLDKAIRVFENHVEVVQQINQRISQQVDVLRSGNFVGVGADAFYREMDTVCLPAMQRLHKALAHSILAIDEIKNTMFSAEEIAEEQVIIGGDGIGGGAIPLPYTSPMPIYETPIPEGESKFPVHTVNRGDTLWDIGQRHGVTVDQLMAANPHIADRNLIHPGQEIVIPTDEGVVKPPASTPAPKSPVGLQGGIGSANYNRMIDEFNVAGNGRYAKRDGNTYCNLFVHDVASKYGATLPLYVTDGRGNTNANITRWLDANLMKDWLDNRLNVSGVYTQGQVNGWVKVDANTAAQAANNGQLAIVAGAGHMAVVRSGNPPQISNPHDVLIAQAGANNFNQGRMIDGWGRHSGQAEFYIYQK